jgi:hypothetical protein
MDEVCVFEGDERFQDLTGVLPHLLER